MFPSRYVGSSVEVYHSRLKHLVGKIRDEAPAEGGKTEDLNRNLLEERKPQGGMKVRKKGFSKSVFVQNLNFPPYLSYNRNLTLRTPCMYGWARNNATCVLHTSVKKHPNF